MPLRIVMMGTGPFATPTFDALLRWSHPVECLVTRPTVVGKGRGPEPVNPMRAVAEAHGLPVFAPQDVNSEESRAVLQSARPDLFVVCDYGQILKPETLAIARLGGINLHGSLLPKYRGAAPINWAIWQGETETGVTVIHMTPQLDGGPILAMRKTPIGPTETSAELEPRLSQLGVEPVLESIARLAAWDGRSSIGELQDASLASRAPRLKKSDGAIDWSRTARRIHNQIRALQPWPGAYTYWRKPGGESVRLVIDRVQLVMTDPADEQAPDDSHAGLIVAAVGGRLVVATGGGLVAIERVQPAGKRMMEVAEFLRGYPIAAGQRFSAQE